MLSLRCQCGGRLKVAQKALGMPTRCPDCGAVVRPVAPWGPLEKGDKEFFARLVIMAGPARVGEQFVLGGPGPIDVGKQSGLGIVLAGELVSHFHTRLLRKGPQWSIHDQQSTNGTGVNGNRITDAQLRQGDRVRIGEYELLFMVRGLAGKVDEEEEKIEEEEEDRLPSPPPSRPPSFSPSPLFPQARGASGPAKTGILSPRVVRIVKWALPVGIVVVALGLILLLRPGESFMYTPGSRVRHAPVQTLISDGKPWTYHGWTLTPLAEFSAEAMVLGKTSYQDALMPLAKWNLAVGWGAMSDPAVVADIRMAQDVRGLQIAFNRAPPVDWQLLEKQMAVIYAIPATDGVLTRIEGLKPGDVVTLRGKLVRAEQPGQRPLVSNLKRGQSFTGEPDVMWIDEVAGK